MTHLKKHFTKIVKPIDESKIVILTNIILTSVKTTKKIYFNKFIIQS